MSNLAPFIHLRARSAYSLLEGAIHIKDLVKWCKKHRMPAVALTDSGNLFGSLEFSMTAASEGIQPIIGCTLFFKPDGEEHANINSRHAAEQLVLLAKDEQGYQNLLRLASKSHLSPPEGCVSPMLRYVDLEGHSDGLIALTGGIHGALGKRLDTGRAQAAEEFLLKLRTLFPERLYIELQRHGLDAEKKVEPELLALAAKHNLPIVATNDAYFLETDMYEAHDALLCIADGRYISETDRRRLTLEYRLKTPKEMVALFADLPEAIENTKAIATRCAVMSPSKAPMLPRFTDAGEDETLKREAREGLEKRLREHVFTESMDAAERERIAQPYRDRLEFELNTIISMKFPGYFLIVSDFIRWSKQRGIPVGPGRGSGAGSVVAWALDITELNPLRYGLLFERFLNPERISMPDFDVDFCQVRRDEVIRYVRERYGHERVAQIITFGKLQARAVLRDVGRVLQMSYGQVDRICKLVPNNPAAPVTLAQAIELEPLLKQAIKEDETVEYLTDLSLKLEGLYRHASTHAAGVVIADRPLEELVPLYRDPKTDMLVTQYSMKYAESAGLVKFDFLGLKTLSVLVEAVALLRRRDIQVDLQKLPEGDPKTYALLSAGDALGVFQMESAGMRDTLRKLKPDTLEDLIALVSLYRPGPMENIPTYIARKHGHEKPTYLHPLLEKVLTETFGVIIYQEQVMQIAQLLAGYSLGEADLLRRAMGKKIRSEMEAQRGTFVERSIARGVEEDLAKSIFDLIAKFAEYGFNKSHAAAYAVIAYQTAYLKANYPVEFFASSMSFEMQNTDKLGIFRAEAERAGIRILQPDINKSEARFVVENGAIRYALGALKNVGEQAMEALVEERKKNGDFKNIFDMAERTGQQVLNRRQLESLIKAGAFDSLHPNRRQLFDAIDTILAHGSAAQRERESNQGSLFGGPSEGQASVTPPLPQVEDYLSIDRLQHEFEAVGFYLSSHPLSPHERALKKQGVVFSSALAGWLGTAYSGLKVAGVVTSKKVRVSPRGRFAFLQLSDMDGSFEVAIFEESLLEKHRELMENGQLLIITAEGKMEEAGPRLIAKKIAALDESALVRHNAEIRIVINNMEAVPGLKARLGAPKPQGMAITLIARLSDGKNAELSLPGYYAVVPSVFEQLKTLAGVQSVEEVA